VAIAVCHFHWLFCRDFSASPTDTGVHKFYRTVRPWGFWKPIHELFMADDGTFIGNKGSLDMFSDDGFRRGTTSLLYHIADVFYTLDEAATTDYGCIDCRDRTDP